MDKHSSLYSPQCPCPRKKVLLLHNYRLNYAGNFYEVSPISLSLEGDIKRSLLMTLQLIIICDQDDQMIWEKSPNF